MPTVVEPLELVGGADAVVLLPLLALLAWA